MKQFLIKLQLQVQYLSKMLQYIPRLQSTQKEDILQQMKQEHRKYLTGQICQQVQTIYILSLGFYASAVLLRYQYPSMIITNTKQIFLKRLKRNKKMLTEQGSSDESKSKTLSRSIQLHTNTFLDSVNSSQLSKKTAQLRDQLFPQFKQKSNLDKSFDIEIHDIHNPQPQEEDQKQSFYKKQSENSQQSFANKLLKLSKNISLSQMVGKQTTELNLSPVQYQINHLICDFDQFDKQLVLKNYEKLRLIEKQNFNSIQQKFQHQQIDKKYQKKSKMIITQIDQNGQQYFNHEKTLRDPYQRYRKLSKPMQQSAIERQTKSRNQNNGGSNFNEQNYNNHNKNKMSAFYQTKRSIFLDSSDQKFYQNQQESYKTLQRFKSGQNNQLKANQHYLKHIFNNNFNSDRIQNLERAPEQQFLQRHRSNNVFNFKRDQNSNLNFQHIQNLNNYNQQITQEQYRKFMPKNNQNNNSSSFNTRKKHSRHQLQDNLNEFNRPDKIRQPNNKQLQYRNSTNQIQNRKNVNQRYISQFEFTNAYQGENLKDSKNRNFPSPRFRNTHQDEYLKEQHNFNLGKNDNNNKEKVQKKLTNHPTIHYDHQQHFPIEKDILKRKHIDQYEPVYYNCFPQNHNNVNTRLEDKVEKKKRIRQKAAQLLSRVKSQEYLTMRGVQMIEYNGRRY